MRRRTALLLTLLITCAVPAGTAQADVRPEDNIATAVTEQDGASTFDFAWEVRRQRGGVVDHLNAARATASCTDCRAAAIAFQVVIAHDSNTVVPRNLAIAIADHCTLCEVYADARQFVRVTETPMVLTGRGRARLNRVRHDLSALGTRRLSPFELMMAVDAEAADVEVTLSRELVPRRHPNGKADVLREDDEAIDQGG